jgi:hypothetical protein
MSNLKAITMTSEEAELIEAYRLSDARGRQTIIEYARSMSEDWPEPRTVPATRDGGE